MASSNSQFPKYRQYYICGFYINFLIVTAIVLPICSNASLITSGKKCNVLGLSGGADRGAYEAGALWGFTEALPKQKYAYDFVAGISVGSVNAFSSLGFSIGEEDKWIPTLLARWRSLRKAQVYKNWPFGVVEGLLTKTGVYNTEPLREYLNEFVANYTNSTQQFTSDRMISVAATDMEAGIARFWNEDTPPYSLVNAVLASSAVPGIFPAIKIDDTIYNDGYLTQPLAIGNAIQKCIQSGKADSDADVVIDLIFCQADSHFGDKNVNHYKSIEFMLRALSILKHYEYSGQVETLKREYPNAVIRYIVRPKKTLPGGLLNFNPEEIEAMIQQGRLDAMEVVRKNKSTL